MSHLSFMWCLMIIFTQLHSRGKEKYPQTEHILCNAAHREVQRIILTSKILGSLQILRNIPEKLQVTIRVLLPRIIIKVPHCRSPNRTHKKVRTARERLPLKWSNVYFTREFEIHQNQRRLVFLNNHPVVCHLERDIIKDKRDKKYLWWSIWNQLVLVYLTGWIINPKKMVHLINSY